MKKRLQKIMIYTYKYLPHRIEGFHTNIVYFFEQLFANDLAVYDENILLLPVFIPIVNASKVRLRDNLELITRTYNLLTDAEKEQTKLAYSANLDIENLCSNVAQIPFKYEALPITIRKITKDFFTMLWEDYPQNKILENYYGTVQEHFNLFVSHTHQKALICPFCGLNKLKVSESINRDAYDHYVPKALYPFTSINFKNLSPMCHECNSDEKDDTDTLFEDNGTRRLVYFPFDEAYESDNLSIDVNPLEPYNPVTLKTLLYDINWNYSITINGISDIRIKAWDDIFHIKRRYRENILRYQIEWFAELTMKYKRFLGNGIDFDEFKRDLVEDLEFQKYISPLGSLKLTYFKFIFSVIDIETKLSILI